MQLKALPMTLTFAFFTTVHIVTEDRTDLVIPLQLKTSYFSFDFTVLWFSTDP